MEHVFKALGRKTPLWWSNKYLLDWISPIVMLGITYLITNATGPFHRYLPENDATVGYPLRADTVPSWSLALLWIGCALIILLHAYFNKNWQDFHHGWLSLYACVCFVNVVTISLKVYAGRYRPDWISTFSADNDNEGRFSFPSGHSSNAFASMIWLTLYLLGKYRAFHPVQTVGFTGSALLSSPIAVAFFVAVSRTRDYKHNFSDITAGALLGVLVAYFVYFLYYPPLSSRRSHLPKGYFEEKREENIESGGRRVTSNNPAIHGTRSEDDLLVRPDKVEIVLNA